MTLFLLLFPLNSSNRKLQALKWIVKHWDDTISWKFPLGILTKQTFHCAIYQSTADAHWFLSLQKQSMLWLFIQSIFLSESVNLKYSFEEKRGENIFVSSKDNYCVQKCATVDTNYSLTIENSLHMWTPLRNCVPFILKKHSHSSTMWDCIQRILKNILLSILYGIFDCLPTTPKILILSHAHGEKKKVTRTQKKKPTHANIFVENCEMRDITKLSTQNTNAEISMRP
jgi:hypothetical protein